MADTRDTKEPGKPRRRVFQFRLRTLLVGVVLIGAACGYVADQWRGVAARNAWMEQHVQDGLTPSAIESLVGDGPQTPEPPAGSRCRTNRCWSI